MNNIYIGKLGKAVGLKGSIKFHYETDFPSQFAKDIELTTNKNQTLIIEHFNQDKKIIKFFGIDTIDEIKKFTNSLLYTNNSDTRDNCKLEDNQFFWFDIIGLSIYSDNLLLGVIDDIKRFGETDYLYINTDIELVNQDLPKSFLIPYIDNYILNVDLISKKIDTKDTFDILENS